MVAGGAQGSKSLGIKAARPPHAVLAHVHHLPVQASEREEQERQREQRKRRREREIDGVAHGQYQEGNDQPRNRPGLSARARP